MSGQECTSYRQMQRVMPESDMPQSLSEITNPKLAYPQNLIT